MDRYSSVAIANRFLRFAEADDVPVDAMKLQKLVYIAHGWHLGYTGEPLCSELVQAWRWGPVFADLYFAVRRWGNSKITEPVLDFWDEVAVPPVPNDDSFAARLIEAVWKMYRRYNGVELSELTHQDGTPWSDIISEQRKRWYSEIPDALIANHYSSKLIRAAQEETAQEATA